jgi:hypothetical protein
MFQLTFLYLSLINITKDKYNPIRIDKALTMYSIVSLENPSVFLNKKMPEVNNAMICRVENHNFGLLPWSFRSLYCHL